MKFGDQVTEHHMVSAFLRAEINRDCFQINLHAIGADKALIDAPDLTDDHANRVRWDLLLACRGNLFKQWPSHVDWWKAEVSAAEVANFRFIYYWAWNEFSGGSRFVRDGIANVDRIENPGAKIKELARLIQQNHRFPELLVVGTDNVAPVVIIEGNTRAAAYVLAGRAAPDPISVIAGYSQDFGDWPLFGSL